MYKFIIAAASLLIAGSAAANDFHFSYSEQDLSSPEAVTSLHQRIESRAQSYCHREYLKTRELNLKEECVDNFVSQITRGIDGGRRFAGVDSEQKIGS